jgi:ATPase subunit of ABC transporter with duplicated ATPase domains
MLQVRNLSKSYGPTTILADLSLIINDGEHIGLIGPNGAGKSTLLYCITGREQPDSGVIVRSPPDLVIGYLAQAMIVQEGMTIGAYLAAAQAEFSQAEQVLHQAANAMAAGGDLATAMAAYDMALAQFEVLGGYEREHRANAILDGLGLREVAHDRLAATLSGGQKTRLGLAVLLLHEPSLLLLDEPTNHLDLDALEWLEGFVKGYPHSVLVVSHDRAFLDATVTRIVYLDPELHTVRSYPGNYTAFTLAREQEQANQLMTWQKQQDYIARVEGDIARLKGQALGVELTTTAAQPNIRRLAKKVAKKAKSRERKLERFLESDERVEKPQQRWGMKLDFGTAPEGGQAVLRVDGVGFGYQPQRTQNQESTTDTHQEQYRLLNEVTFEVMYGERVAIVGPNGMGKTTLLRLIEGKLEPQTGRLRLGAGVRLGVLAQEHEALDPQRTLLDTVLRLVVMPFLSRLVCARMVNAAVYNLRCLFWVAVICYCWMNHSIIWISKAVSILKKRSMPLKVRSLQYPTTVHSLSISLSVFWKYVMVGYVAGRSSSLAFRNSAELNAAAVPVPFVPQFRGF